MRDEGKDGEAGMTAIRETRETVKSERIPWKEGCRGEMGQETYGSNERDGWRMRVLRSRRCALPAWAPGVAVSCQRPGLVGGRERGGGQINRDGLILQHSEISRHLTAKFAFSLIRFHPTCLHPLSSIHMLFAALNPFSVKLWIALTGRSLAWGFDLRLYTFFSYSVSDA
ncbi:hypothetical protein KUCAC02_012923 [Chaenocephalus aceratus]|uniref:Uncharacterized protein n=1 Tax=Chaenocephalus aceratus TaxID=36190 RepID=A0ACB9XE47_CHAAC|nr:hypothetical protein KUCAC02_012923 [Chaenocephalus aceratus]